MTTSYHALVIDDDEGIREDVEGRLESLGHTCDSVGCQHTARHQLNAGNKYAYILLDLQIPLRYGKKPLVQNGKNLLNQIREITGIENMPVIVMTAHGLDNTDLVVEMLCDHQATGFIKKPFPSTGGTLEKRITEALSGRNRRGTAKASNVAQITGDPQPFEHGEMVFFEHRVELCDVKICSGPESGMIRSILDELRHKNTRQAFVAYSGTELARRVNCPAGQNGVAGAIREFRQKASQLLLGEENIKCDPRDIIQSGGRGYRFTEKVTVRDVDDPVNENDDPVNDPVNVQHDPLNDPIFCSDNHEYNARQQWALGRMHAGKPVQMSDLIMHHKCSNSTAKRDLTDLRQRGVIEFTGPPKTGHWQLVRQTTDARYY